MGCKLDIEYFKRSGGWNVFVGWQNSEVYDLPGDMHSTFYLSCSAWWTGNEGCYVLTITFPPVLSYFSDLMLRQELGQGLVWITAVIKFTFLSIFRFLVALITVGSAVITTVCTSKGTAS